MANRWQWNVLTVDEFQLLCVVLERLCRLSLTSTTEAQMLGKSGARSFGDLAGEEIAYVAGFLLKDIRNLKGKVDVFALYIVLLLPHLCYNRE